MIRKLLRSRQPQGQGSQQAAHRVGLNPSQTGGPSSPSASSLISLPRVVLLAIIFICLSLGRVQQQRPEELHNIEVPTSRLHSHHQSSEREATVALLQKATSSPIIDDAVVDGAPSQTQLHHPVQGPSIVSSSSHPRRYPVVAEPAIDASWPLTTLTSPTDIDRLGLNRGTRVHCSDRGMQSKCRFENLVSQNQLWCITNCSSNKGAEEADAAAKRYPL